MDWEKGLIKSLFLIYSEEIKELILEILEEHPELIPKKTERRQKRMLRNKDIKEKYNIYPSVATSRINDFPKLPRNSLQCLMM